MIELFACEPCSRGDHEACQMWVPTGYLVPAPRTRASAPRMVPEHRQCRCVCRDFDRGIPQREVAQ